MEKQKNTKKYYIGLDIGTDSVGYAVTDENYNLLKHRGEPMWGVTVFDATIQGQERRSFRTARRRLDRRQHRVALTEELLAPYIVPQDRDFFKRIHQSALIKDEVDNSYLFDSIEKTKEYYKKYPTIHHLLCALMNGTAENDTRLLYIACAWLVAHRGHFLSEVDKEKIDAVTDFHSVYFDFCNFFENNDSPVPWDANCVESNFESVMKQKLGMNKKLKLLKEAVFKNGKIPQNDEDCIVSWEHALKLICGGKVKLADLFSNDSYSEFGSLSLDSDDETIAQAVADVDSDGEILVKLKMLYDWSVLVDALKGKNSISEGKVEVYNQHKKDLAMLKMLVHKYLPTKYKDIFDATDNPLNYAAYTYHSTKGKVNKKASKTDFCDYIKKLFKEVKIDSDDVAAFEDMSSRLETESFMPKQRDGDNRVIPYQLYWYELKTILDKSSEKFPFLNTKDDDGISIAEKLLSVFEFRVPYYVGPLRNDGNNKNAWMERKATGKIYPWNFDKIVDLDKSENAFIEKMLGRCTYLSGESVLPKNSLLYSSFTVLNEINNLKINNEPISVEIKQEIYSEIFMNPTNRRVSLKKIQNYLLSRGYIEKTDTLSGADINLTSTLNPYHLFRRLLEKNILSENEVEEIITRSTYTEDRNRFEKWLRENYSKLCDDDIKYVRSLKLKDFGRLSKKLLCDMFGCPDDETGEARSVIRAMWDTNLNINQLILSDNYTYKAQIEAFNHDYYSRHPKSLNDRLDDMYISNAVKRPIIRTLDILKDITKVMRSAPEAVFVEMARGTNEDLKGKRTQSRLAQVKTLYEKIDKEEVRLLSQQLDSLGETAENRLQSDKIFLYFMQLGKCLYTGKTITFESVLKGDGTYNIEHIYPRCHVKDDSIINNKILVDSKANEAKGDSYPIAAEIQADRAGLWKYLHDSELISDEKYKRLTRKTRFTDEEKNGFINRQLVETRQSTKAVATILKEKYPDTEICYVKAGLVSDFRQQFSMLKSRAINDLHHAKDAYLNIVVGNVYYSYFNKNYFRLDDDYNLKTEIMFSREVKCGSRVVWEGGKSVDMVRRNVAKNTAHLTKYAFCRKGGFFDQMPLKANEGLIPLKKGMPTEIYGGYNKPTASFFVLVKYKTAKKEDIMVMPVELLYADKFIANEDFAKEYSLKTVESIIGKKTESVEFLLNKRILKVNTMLSLDGLRVCLTGKSGGGSKIMTMIMSSFKSTYENENYIKKLESFTNKKRNNDNIVYDIRYDIISKEKNEEIYCHFIEKFQRWPYNKRPANPVNTLTKAKEEFLKLDVSTQADVLLRILGLFGRINNADLKIIGGSGATGVATLSTSMSNWRKSYTDVRIIDTSASGLFETQSENLLDLL
ncbi:MAG: type II CRISPR RNA-guided endonuclease Cas9 [Ruminococcaceae bacterium]|nr:type II CRISPR RNA-guided endonuclease Cas9 [Oscillospiraceae bacterium]